MKCCANCEWSISPTLEEEIMREQGYDEEDPDRPHAGDCCIGMEEEREKRNDYCCSKHLYIDGMEEYETYCLYDESYLGPGYLLISKLDDEIVKFMKISTYDNNGYPTFSIRGYDKNSKFNLNENFRQIEICVQKGEPLYKAIKTLADCLMNQRLYSIDPSNQGKSFIQTYSRIDESNLIPVDTVFISLYQDTLGVKEGTDTIDILLGDNYSCENYPGLINFYNELKKIAPEVSTEEDIQRLLKMTKKN